MSRQVINKSAAAVAIAVAALLVCQTVQANFYLNLINTTSPATQGTQTITVDATHQNFTLQVWGVITDPTNSEGDSLNSLGPFISADNLIASFSQISAGFETTGAVFKGDVQSPASAASRFSTSGVGSALIVAGLSQTGNSFIAPNGAKGLGGSTPTDPNTAWWLPAAASYTQNGYFINSSGGTIATPGGFFNDGGADQSQNGQPDTFVNSISPQNPPLGQIAFSGTTGAYGVEYLLGNIVVSFSNYYSNFSSTLTGTNTMALATITRNGGGTTVPYQFTQSTTSAVQQYGISSLVGSNGSLLLKPINFVFVSTNTGGSTAAAIGASLSATGPTTVLSNVGTIGVAGSVSNTAASSNPLDWSAALSSGLSLTTTSATSVANGTPSSFTGSIAVSPTTFGPFSAVAVFSGTDHTTGLAATNSPVTQTVNYMVIGKATTGAAWVPNGGTQGVFSTAQSPLLTTATLPQGTPLAGIGTTLGSSSASFGLNQTSANILAGSLANSGAVTMQWRPRAPIEVPASHPVAPNLPVYSDVVDLNGVSGGTAGIYALEVSYDPNELGTGTAAIGAASNGYLFLGYRSTTDQKWHSAVATVADGVNDGNTTAGTAAVTKFLGTWNQFLAANNPNGGANSTYSLQQLLGSWGVDTANNFAWAIVDHNSEFAVVPEPGTLALLAGGAIALGIAYRRRKAAKA